MIPASERAKTVHASHRAAILIVLCNFIAQKTLHFISKIFLKLLFFLLQSGHNRNYVNKYSNLTHWVSLSSLLSCYRCFKCTEYTSRGRRFLCGIFICEFSWTCPLCVNMADGHTVASSICSTLLPITVTFINEGN
jgi:hypothetical protein